MARTINLSIEVTDEELANFLQRVSGADGRKVAVQADTEDEGPTNATAPATDKNGVAWDARYHASSKALVADGTWRARKGMTDAEKAEAEAYNKSGNAPVVESAAPIPSIPAVPSSLPGGMPGLPVPTPAPVAPTPVSYEEVVALFQQAAAKDPTLATRYAEVYAQAGITDASVLNTDAGAEQRINLANILKGVIG